MSFERNLHYDATETERRSSNTVLMARVEEIDAEKARIRVSAAEIESAWIPFSSSRAGPDRTWHAPEPGEQIVLVVPCGDLNNAVYVGSVYQDAYPAPVHDVDVSLTEWKDGAVQRYDRAGHHWLLDVPSGGTITLRVGESALVISDGGVEWTSSGTIRLSAARIELN